jgi:hypothetical protein
VRAPLPWQAAVDFLAQAGISPVTDPGKFDECQRDMERWWNAGGSLHGFVAAVKAGESTRSLSAAEARRILERRFAPSWMRS